MHKKFLCIFLTVVLVLGLCACGGDKSDTLIMPINKDPMCLDPQVADSDEAKLLIANCYEGLVRLDKDNNIIPGVAESWNISADGLTYTFNLRKDTHWKLLNSFKDILPENYKDTYRTEVVAADFVFGLRRALNPETQATDAEKLFCIKNAASVNSGKASVSSIGVQAKDNYTLVIRLEKANTDFLRILTLPIAMPCHEEFFNATHAKYGLDLEYTFCNGPFYLSRWAEDNTLSMYKNDEYNGNTKVKPDELYFYVNTEESSVVKKIRQRTYDCAFISESANKELSDNNNLTRYSVDNTVYGLCFNCSDSVLSNEDMRRALVMVTKTNELTAGSDSAFSAGIVPNCVRYGNNSYREAVGNVNGISYNEQQALTLWKKGLKKLDITTAEIVVTCTEENAPIMQQTIQNWQRVFSTSILAKVEIKTADEISTSIYNTNYQILYHKISTNSSTVTDTLKKFTSDSSSNFFGFSDKNYDKLVTDIISTYSGSQIIKGCASAEKMILDKAVFLPLFSGSSYAVVNKGVDGIYFSPAFENACFISGGHK